MSEQTNFANKKEKYFDASPDFSNRYHSLKQFANKKMRESLVVLLSLFMALSWVIPHAIRWGMV